MKRHIFVLLFLIMCSVNVRKAYAFRVNLLVHGDVESGWTYSGTDYHVAASMTGNGRGGTGNALSLTNSIYDLTTCWLDFSTGNVLSQTIPNNTTVYVGAWVKVSSNFGQTVSNSGIEVRLKLSSPYKEETYWSNTASGTMNGLIFGWTHQSSIPFSRLTTDWQYFEFPVVVGDSGWAGGWTFATLGVTDRVGWRGDLAAGFNGTIYLDDMHVDIDISILPEPTVLTVGDQELGVGLATNINYALSSITSGNSTFDSGLLFPTFTAYDVTGNSHVFYPIDSEWQSNLIVNGRTATVTYSRTGLSLQVMYDIQDDMILVSVVPINESGYKLISVNDGGSIACLFANDLRSQNAFILVPYSGGEIVRLPSQQENKMVSHNQSWWYTATFFGIGVDDQQGLLFRCPQYGAIWTYGTKSVRGRYSLSGGLECFFRPGASKNFSYPLADPIVNIQIVPVGDKNKDSNINWVDLGVTYRERFIKRNQSLDPGMLDSIVGKIDISAPQCSTDCLNYSQIISQIADIATSNIPQVWWLVGAHTPTGNRFEVPPYSTLPDSSHNGDNGFNYFAFKQAATGLDARIGIHEMPQYISSGNEGWGNVPLLLGSNGQPVGGWSTDNGVAYYKAINDSSFKPFLDQHFSNWQVGAGDTWHWDVFTAEEPRENYDMDRLATKGTDFRSRIEILQHITEKGIHITNEGLQEGVAEFSSFAYWFPIGMSDWGNYSNEFSRSSYVPLVPILFQGKTYYGSGWNVGKSLLYGARYSFEGANLAANKATILNQYYQQVVYWRKIANKTVLDIDQDSSNPDLWYVTYTSGGTLRANVNDGTFILNVPEKCGDTGTVYLPQDLNQDCYVNFKDLAVFAARWLTCTNPVDSNCN